MTKNKQFEKLFGQDYFAFELNDLASIATLPEYPWKTKSAKSHAKKSKSAVRELATSAQNGNRPAENGQQHTSSSETFRVIVDEAIGVADTFDDDDEPESDQADSSNGHADSPNRLRYDVLARISLLEIEAKLAEGKRTGEITDWLAKHVDQDGFFILDPPATLSIVPALARITLSGRVKQTKPIIAAIEKMVRSGLRAESCLIHRLDHQPVHVHPAEAVTSDSAETVTSLATVDQFSFLKTLSKLPDFTGIKTAVKRARADQKPVKKIKDAVGVQSDASNFAAMRSAAQLDADLVRVDYRLGQFALEAVLAKRHLFTGNWLTQIMVDGKSLDVAGEWESTCYFGDVDAEYCEFQQMIGGGLVLERQILLPRHSKMMMFADSLKSARDEELVLEWQLPLAQVPTVTGDLDSRRKTLTWPIEAKQAGSKTSAFCLHVDPVGAVQHPLHTVSPASTSVKRISIGLSQNHLVINAAGKGTRLHLPIVFALGDDSPHVNAERAGNKKATTKTGLPDWKQLLVTSDRSLINCDEAVAWRTAIPADDNKIASKKKSGKRQGRSDTQSSRYLIYFRSLGQRKVYNFIGKQTRSECLIGEMSEGNKFRAWVEIE